MNDAPLTAAATEIGLVLATASDIPRRALSAPPMHLRAMESRAMFELGALFASAPWLRALGRGDRHPVLVMPGFTGGDDSTVLLRQVLRSWGYWAHGWGLGSNMGPTTAALSGMRERLAALHDRHDRRVSIVGWSLGGLYARMLARESPHRVRQVITLGTPLQLRARDRTAASGLGDRLEPGFDPSFERLPESERPPLPVPSTSVYSRADGIVRWQACLDVVDDLHENVEVRGSHIGLGFNPSALLVISDRLAQPEDQWRSFRPPVPLRFLYPRPEAWAPEGRVKRTRSGQA